MVAQLPIEWQDLFDMEMLNDVLEVVTIGGSGDYTPKNIFEAFNYVIPSEICCVIVGQDPYPAQDAADGLCFSASPAQNPFPASLINIFRCLDNSGLRKTREKKCADLHCWATQGVLMLNTALTTRVGEIKAHSILWRPVIQRFIENFCRSRAGSNIPFMMWGQDAQRFTPIVEKYGHLALHWTHPSPIIDNKLDDDLKFKNCPHFTIVNKHLSDCGLRPIKWDNQSSCVALTDGACTGNGKSSARASFAVVIAGGHFRPSIIRGEIFPNEYEVQENAVVPNRAVKVSPSNNRGELLGIIYAMNYFLNEYAYGCIEIISDSNISINTLTDWLPTRLANGTEHELKNFDLVMIAWNLLNRLRKQALHVKFTHCKAHQPTPADDTPRERFIHMGNGLADYHATEVLKQRPSVDTKQIEILQLSTS